MRLTLHLVLGLLLLSVAGTSQKPPTTPPSTTLQPTSLTPLSVYAGSWDMKSAHPMAGTGKIDHLVNHCHLDAAFYTCEQVVNGKPFTLVIFVPGQEPGHYYTQAVLANGRATGRTSLIIAGNHWTYSGNGTDAAGKPAFYRTENYFTGADAIHFEQYGSSDQKTWTKKDEGDEIRLKSSDLPAKN